MTVERWPQSKHKEEGPPCVRCGSRTSARFVTKGEVICEYRVGCRTREIRMKSNATGSDQ